MMEITQEEYNKFCALKRLEKLNDYAQEYWKGLTNNLFAETFSSLKLPIIFQEKYIKKKNGEITSGVTRELILKGNKTMIYIVVCCNEELDTTYIKETIRHELFHLILKMKGLKNSDCSAIFWIVSEIFNNGDSYGELDAVEKSIYEMGIGIVRDAFELVSKQPDDLGKRLNLSMLLEQLGSVDYKEQKDLEELRFNIKALNNAMTFKKKGILNRVPFLIPKTTNKRL